jgi:hypothetical protein
VRKNHLEESGKVKDGFKFGDTILFGDKEGEKLRDFEDLTMHILKSVA